MLVRVESRRCSRFKSLVVLHETFLDVNDLCDIQLIQSNRFNESPVPFRLVINTSSMEIYVIYY